MKHLLTHEERERLGLQDAQFGQVQRVAIPEGAPEGRAALHNVAVPARPREIAIENPWGVRFFIWTDARRWHGELCGEVPMETVPLDPSLPISTTDDRLRVTFALPSACLVRVSGGDGFVVRWSEREILFQPLHSPLPPSKSLAKTEPPIDALVADLQGAWIREEVEKYSSDPWSRVVAMGLILRYFSADLGSNERRALLADLSAGKTPEVVMRIRSWRDALDDDQRGAILGFARTARLSLQTSLDSLRETFALEPAWIDKFVTACVKRDDLEAVRWLMAGPTDLDEALKDLDDAAWAFVVTLPAALRPDHPRLLRAAALDPTAWWIRPVQWPEIFELP